MLAAAISNLSTVGGPHCFFQNLSALIVGWLFWGRNERIVLNHVYHYFGIRPFLKFVFLYVNRVLPLPDYLISIPEPSSVIFIDNLLALE